MPLHDNKWEVNVQVKFNNLKAGYYNYLTLSSNHVLLLTVSPFYRRAFMQLAASPEAFLTLRSHFVRTIASVSSCQYVMGIGDRHLSNFMVDLESGGIVGIDFGHNFGTATQVMPHSDS